MSNSLDQKRDQLLAVITQMQRVVVAFSAGVDSTVVAKAAHLACGENAVAVTAVSPSLASGELETAQSLARQIGIEHRIIKTAEFDDSNYTANPANRCYFCKSELYSRLEEWLPAQNWGIVVNGANADDVGDHRPGMIAASENNVRSPLLEVGLAKAEVRELARQWDLPVWDKPAMPCLSSRIAYGVEVTPERVARIDAAEQFLREEFQIQELRVRLGEGEQARIEVPVSEISRLQEQDAFEKIESRFSELGFRGVEVDPAGFRSGSLNAALSPDQLQILDG